ncbi:MAG TPA: hypothetical protein VFH49_11965 [Aquabacterium sp.]|nr:hypothetical protein [Aquabacterium sp.]
MKLAAKTLLLALCCASSLAWATTATAVTAASTSASTSASTPAGKPTAKASAQVFWSAFRQAVAQGDDAALQSMVKLPLLVRGEMDDDPVQRVGRARLKHMLHEVLDQPIFSSEGGATVKRSLREVITRTEQLPARAWMTPTSFRVEQLEFQWSRGQWKLTRAYLSPA